MCRLSQELLVYDFILARRPNSMMKDALTFGPYNKIVEKYNAVPRVLHQYSIKINPKAYWNSNFDTLIKRSIYSLRTIRTLDNAADIADLRVDVILLKVNLIVKPANPSKSSTDRASGYSIASNAEVIMYRAPSNAGPTKSSANINSKWLATQYL